MFNIYGRFNALAKLNTELNYFDPQNHNTLQ